MKVIGKVSEDECEQIKKLFERKNGLVELANTLSPQSSLYERIVEDMGVTSTKYQAWWDEMSKKYNWESSPGGRWSIDFNTCEISLE